MGKRSAHYGEARETPHERGDCQSGACGMPRVVRLLRLRPPVLRGEARRTDLVRVRHETRDGGCRIRRQFELVRLECIHGEHVAMRLVAGWWAGAAPCREAV